MYTLPTYQIRIQDYFSDSLINCYKLHIHHTTQMLLTFSLQLITARSMMAVTHTAD